MKNLFAVLLVFKILVIWSQKEEIIHHHKFPNGKTSTICVIKDDRDGYAKAFNLKGEEITCATFGDMPDMPVYILRTIPMAWSNKPSIPVTQMREFNGIEALLILMKTAILRVRLKTIGTRALQCLPTFITILQGT